MLQRLLQKLLESRSPYGFFAAHSEILKDARRLLYYYIVIFIGQRVDTSRTHNSRPSCLALCHVWSGVAYWHRCPFLCSPSKQCKFVRKSEKSRNCTECLKSLRRSYFLNKKGVCCITAEKAQKKSYNRRRKFLIQHYKVTSNNRFVFALGTNTDVLKVRDNKRCLGAKK